MANQTRDSVNNQHMTNSDLSELDKSLVKSKSKLHKVSIQVNKRQ